VSLLLVPECSRHRSTMTSTKMRVKIRNRCAEGSATGFAEQWTESRVQLLAETRPLWSGIRRQGYG